MLLSRVADSLYWAARYLERADDTARLVWGYTEGIVDLPTSVNSSWEPLLATTGTQAPFDAQYGPGAGEREIVSFLLADSVNPSSVLSSIVQARENLRSCRDVIPQFAWTVLNDLYLYALEHDRDGVERRARSRFIERVRRDVERIQGIVATTMIRDAAYNFWMIGQWLERADMTTRVLGVQAAGLLGEERGINGHVEVQWMTVLRSVSGRQMYQRATRQPIEGPTVVDFLLHSRSFPRSVQFCVDAVAEHLAWLPRSSEVRPMVAGVTAELTRPLGDVHDGAALDASMDRIQFALADLSRQIIGTYC
jgi:uncharacterized alpha-E superfamily protein